MKKRTILILLIISTIVSITYILLSYFGIIRYLLLHAYKPERYIENYSKLSKANEKKKTKIVIQSDEKNINKIKPFLNSVLDQTCKIDNIIVVLPNKNIKIPEYLSKFATITEGNDISNVIKKQKDADTILLHLQDDIVYGKDFIEKIVQLGCDTDNHACGKYSKLYQINKYKENEIKSFEPFNYSENFKRF